MSEIEKPILTVGQDQFLKGKSFDTYKKKLQSDCYLFYILNLL